MSIFSRLVSVVRQLLGMLAVLVARALGGSGASLAGFDGSGVSSVGGGTALPAVRSAKLGLLLASVLTAAALLALGAAPAFADSCPNDQFRTGLGVFLPDCRAYELVTPPEGGSQDIFAFSGVTDQARVGDTGAVLLNTFSKLGPNPGSGAGSDGGRGNAYVFSRGPSAWALGSIYPADPGQTGYTEQITSSDLSRIGVDSADFSDFVHHGPDQTFGVGPAGGPYTPIATTPINDNFVNVLHGDKLAGASSDFQHVVLQSTDSSLLPGAAGTDAGAYDLYEWTGGGLRLVNVTTGGSLVSACGAELGSNEDEAPQGENPISADGSRIFFSAPDQWANADGRPSDPSCDQPAELYVRENGTTTVDISCPTPVFDPGGCQSATFVGASADGSKVFFTTSTELTPDDAGIHDQELYEYDTASGALTRVSRGASGTAAASVAGEAAISGDGSTVYFAAGSQLTPDAPAPPAGEQDLYRYDTASGTTTYVAELAALSTSNFQATSDGRFALFVGDQAGTPEAAVGIAEVYRYDSAENRVTCVSCRPDGSSPHGAGFLPQLIIDGNSVLAIADTTNALPHAISEDGRYVFFDSNDELVPRDANGLPSSGQTVDTNLVGPFTDVYEWESQGTGGCANAGGCVHLLSSGAGDVASTLLGASADGSDVLIGTHDPLVSWDDNQMGDIYDVRVDGGFPGPSVPAGCSGDGCQGPLSRSPSLPTAASVTFTGPGNATSTANAKTGRVKVLRRAVVGSRFVLTVRVPARGRIVVTGAGVRTATRSVARAGTYRLTVALTAREKQKLRRRKKLRLTLHVGYTPATGTPSSAIVSMTVKR